ncbi:hypothetical protein AVEN_184704-1 [Araneus ventricosus]|uniref:Uncharacterized protein n=1 Tax=Araneus ventricosus TaxID=182803 RepID=A0A4Y2RGT3_ARAVE|nr:hypothetical protein AVEN_184704-1 [Araneus ventricosus]
MKVVHKEFLQYCRTFIKEDHIEVFKRLKAKSWVEVRIRFILFKYVRRMHVARKYRHSKLPFLGKTNLGCSITIWLKLIGPSWCQITHDNIIFQNLSDQLILNDLAPYDFIFG